METPGLKSFTFEKDIINMELQALHFAPQSLGNLFQKKMEALVEARKMLEKSDQYTQAAKKLEKMLSEDGKITAINDASILQDQSDITAGKAYLVNDIVEDGTLCVLITDDSGDNHLYDLETLDLYFLSNIEDISPTLSMSV